MMRHTSTIVAVPSQADTRSSSIGVTWSTNALGACSYALDCKPAAESWSDRALFPGKRGRSPCGRFVRATGCDAHAGTQRVPPVTSTSSHTFLQIWPFRIQIWTEGVLLEHPAPLVGSCNPVLAVVRILYHAQHSISVARSLSARSLSFQCPTNIACLRS
jgi:hypothetical protein